MGFPASYRFTGGLVTNKTEFQNVLTYDTLFRQSTQLTTLSGNTNINCFAANFFDCNGADRNATFTTAGTLGETYYIRNIGYANNLTVLNSAAGKIDTLFPGQSGTYYWDGVNWDETNISNPLTLGDCKLWVRADKGTFTSTLVNSATQNDADTVRSWFDYSGYANHLTLGTPPTIKNSIQNSLPIIRFNGTSHFLQTTNGIALSEYSAFIVCARSWTDGNSIHAIMGNSGGAANVGQAIFHGSSTQDWGTNAFVAYGAGYNSGAPPRAYSAAYTPANGTFHVIAAIVGSTSEFWVDGTVISTFKNTGFCSGANSIMFLGKASVGTTYFWPGDIAEFIIYSGNIGLRNKIKVERMLGSRWGVTVA